MNKILRFLVLIFSVYNVNAQPGGGGGLTIKNLYDNYLNAIDLKSPGLKIRNFVLNGNSVREELYDFRPLHLEPSKWNYYTGREQPNSDQRLLIQFNGETMIVDLINIMQENGMGISDYMDSLVFSRGHFKVITNLPNNKRTGKWQTNAALLNNGITPFTIAALEEPGWIKFSNEVDQQFLYENNLSAHFILKRGVNDFRKGKYNSAITDIERALSNGLSTGEKEEALATLSSCYSKVYDYYKALQLINEIIESRTVVDNYRLMNYYKARIEIYTAMKNYDLALSDYDYIITSTNEHQLAFIAEKAEYKKKYLSDCFSSIQDFERTVNDIPSNHLSDRPGGWSEYAETFFAFASLEYSCGYKNDAYDNWLKAMEFGYGQTSTDFAVLHFDSIIRLNPNEPRLYLSRAIAYYKRAPYLGWGDQTKAVLHKSVLDIDKAESLGMSDFRINLYRAQSLNLLKMNDDALADINIAIKKNKDDPRAYSVRYRILTDLGKIVWGQDHPDLIKYRELSEKWNFHEK